MDSLGFLLEPPQGSHGGTDGFTLEEVSLDLLRKLKGSFLSYGGISIVTWTQLAKRLSFLLHVVSLSS
ncbi:hypothetical protein U1Q18_003364 [Sarracenia purpurea var. burkii]